ncbi:MAG: hypothetical protein JNK14_07850 [Chitinophagaceae bacterium]|nr:hypothetical protein [Chitinophagaceae bacterium]
MSVILGLILLAILLWFWRIKRKALLQYEYEYKLASLRDELRWQYINDQIDKESWIYKYIDTTIPIASRNLRYFNIYTAIGLGFIHSKDKKFQAFKSSFLHEIEVTKNENVKKINTKFSQLILEYVLRKHILFKFIVLGLYLTTNKKNKRPPTSTEKKIYNLGLYPETSASREFMPC